MPPKNLLTFDIEPWYDANYPDVNLEKQKQKQKHQSDRLEKEVDKIIELCAKYNVRATCFVLGVVGERHPHLVKKLHEAGHEIASHGYDHYLVYEMSPEEFEESLTKAKKILEEIIDEKVIGFRAPSWSVRRETLEWYYPTLKKLGFKYSSSVFPVNMGLYGISRVPEGIYERNSIYEISPSIVHMFSRGIGFYFRLFPFWFMKKYIKKRNKKGRTVLIYLHPREIDPKAPHLKLKFPENIFHYFGVRGDAKKLEKCLVEFGPTFYRIKDVI